MRFRPASRVAIAGTSLIASWAWAPPAPAQYLIGSPLIPTSSVVSTSAYLPTSYVGTSYLSSSYLPTSYVVPTSSYVATGGSTYLPTSYVTSSYYRGGLFRPRRFVERTSYLSAPTSFYSPTTYVTPTSYLSSSYIPTSYLSSSYIPTSYIPTSYYAPTVATSAILPTTYLAPTLVAPTSYLVDDGLIATTASTAAPCYDAVAPSPTPTRSLAVPRTMAPTNPGNPIISTPAPGAGTTVPNERRPSASTNGGDGSSSNVYPDAAAPAVPVAPKAPLETPPQPMAPDDPSKIEVPPAGSGAKPSTDEGVSRTSMRPAYRVARNVLRGRVVSYETGQPEEAVAVVLVNRAGGFNDRKTLTDADGEFKISIPDGDWAVRVTMPSGSIYTVGRGVTASGGRVVDANNQNVRELQITR